VLRAFVNERSDVWRHFATVKDLLDHFRHLNDPLWHLLRLLPLPFTPFRSRRRQVGEGTGSDNRGEQMTIILRHFDELLIGVVALGLRCAVIYRQLETAHRHV